MNSHANGLPCSNIVKAAGFFLFLLGIVPLSFSKALGAVDNPTLSGL